MSRRPLPTSSIALLAAGIASLFVSGCRLAEPARADESPAAPATFVGRATCGSCHPRELALYVGSHHDRAMEVPSAASVLGDFSDARFDHRGVATTFFRRGDRFAVRTDGPDGAARELEVAATFGVEPLQQLLVPGERGRLQALSVAWDARPASAGGQRWFSLDPPGEHIAPGDPLHWTGDRFTWNSMCAECHSTGLEKNYRPGDGTFETRSAEIDVSCEACHGAGSKHVAWARGGRPPLPGQGFVATLGRGDGFETSFDPVFDPRTRSARGIAPAVRGQARVATQVDACGRCHARRTPITPEVEPGRPLLATHDLALLDENLYFPDGQIEDEVFEVGSFQQSKMHAHGVICTDCHEPHAGTLRAAGDALCARCHDASRFARREHHGHAPESTAARCVTCHMPERTYMGVDRRRDHSLRVPRPDLSATLGVPNPCNGCHAGKTPEWASRVIAETTGRAPAPHFGTALDAGRRGLPNAPALLLAAIDDPAVPAIARATALGLLARQPGRDPAALAARIEVAARAADPLLRRAAATAAEALDPESRWRLAAPLLDDDLAGVRIEAARALAPLRLERERQGHLGAPDRARLERAIGDYRAAQWSNAERPEAHVNLGWMSAQLGALDDAEAEFRHALALDPRFPAAAIDLAEVHRLRGRDDLGEVVLREALAHSPRDAALHHALGLLAIRRGHLADAVADLAAAVELAPREIRYSTVLAAARAALAEPAGTAAATPSEQGAR